MLSSNKTTLIVEVMKFYRQDPTLFMLSVWENAMRSYDFEKMSKAIDAHFANPDSGQFMPKPADIIKAMAGTKTDRATLAWSKVHEAVRLIGAYTDVIFDDSAIHAVIQDLGGWPKICATESKDIGYTIHRFCESYRAYCISQDFAYQGKLIGIRSPDHDYARRGLPVPEPKLVGYPDVAMAVLAGGTAGGKTQITDPNKVALAGDLMKITYSSARNPTEMTDEV